jgi:hypothetical protein
MYIIIMADDFTGTGKVKKYCRGKPSESGEKQTALNFFISL